MLTGRGFYVYRLLTAHEARAWLAAGGWESRTGYPATAEHVQALCGVGRALSREAITVVPGHEVLIERLKHRVQDPAQKATWQPGSEDWEYGLLIMKSQFSVS